MIYQETVKSGRPNQEMQAIVLLEEMHTSIILVIQLVEILVLLNWIASSTCLLAPTFILSNRECQKFCKMGKFQIQVLFLIGNKKEITKP